MKIKLIEAVGHYVDHSAVGNVHLIGVLDSTACGLALEDYDYVKSTKELTCETCKTFLSWAKKVSKIKS